MLNPKKKKKVYLVERKDVAGWVGAMDFEKWPAKERKDEKSDARKRRKRKAKESGWGGWV